MQRVGCISAAPFGFLALAIVEICSEGVFAAQLRSQKATEDVSSRFFSYDYSQQGENWKQGQCSSRYQQSPIDLPPPLKVTKSFTYKYNPIVNPFELMNNGHTFAADLAGQGYGGITYQGAWYNLMTINIHSLSEHSWNGMQMPLEIHMVHKRFDSPALLVVAVAVESPLLSGATMLEAYAAKMNRTGFLQTKAVRREVNAKFWKAFRDKQMPGMMPGMMMAGPSGMSPVASSGMPPVSNAKPKYKPPPVTDPGFNPMIQAFLKSHLPPVNMKVRVPVDSVNPYQLNSLMQGGQFFEYHGSMTAPPCAEIVTWLVRKDSVIASDEQVLMLHDGVYKTTADFGNFRALMPLSDRDIFMAQATLEDPPLAVSKPIHVAGNVQHSDREFRAMKWGMDAMMMAKDSLRYVKDLDTRVRNAAVAHADALKPQPEPITVDGKVIVAPNGGADGALEGLVQPLLPGKNTKRANTPEEMKRTAENLSGVLAEAARKAVEEAMKEITAKTRKVAMDAAMEASNVVRTGVGNQNALATGAMPGIAIPATPVGPPPGVPQDQAPAPAAANP